MNDSARIILLEEFDCLLRYVIGQAENVETFEKLLAGAPLPPMIPFELLPRQRALQRVTQRLWSTNLASDEWPAALSPHDRAEIVRHIETALAATREAGKPRPYTIGGAGSEAPPPPLPHKDPGRERMSRVFAARVRRFRLLYAAITRELRGYARGYVRNHDPALSDWFEELMRAFLERFHAWEHDADLQSYFQLFDGRSADLQLAAHVFLHISLDLPVAIGEQLAVNPFAPSRSDGRLAYLGPTYLFPEIFERQGRRYAVGGVLGVASRLLPASGSVLGMISQWVLALRSIAWIHGEYLADNVARSSSLERRLRGALLDAGRRAARGWWLTRVPWMHTRRMNRLAIVNPLLYASEVGAAALGVLLLVWFRRDAGAAGIGRFAEDIAFFTHKALAEFDGEEESPQP